MSNEVQVIEKEQVQYSAPAQINPMQLMQIAVESNADLDKLEKLMDLQERYDAGNARKAFYTAMAQFQQRCPDIKKMKQGHNYKYAPLGDIMSQIKDLMASCGLSLRYEQDHSAGITVTCIVTHKDGHSEKTTMVGDADKTGSKNGIQAVGSTVTYLQRYTTICALGITTADEDIDARVPVTNKSVIDVEKRIVEVMQSQGRTDQQLFAWLSKAFKREIQSFDDMSDDEMQITLRKLEGKA